MSLMLKRSPSIYRAAAILFIVSACCFVPKTMALTVIVPSLTGAAINASIRSACNGVAAGTVVLQNGTYAINSAIGITGNCTLLAATPGSVILKANQSQIFVIYANGVTINGLTFDGGWVSFGGAASYSDFVFTNNTIQNIWSGGISGGPIALSGSGLVHSTISKNKFFNIWANGAPGYPNAPPAENSGNCPGVDCWGSAAISFHGLDQTTIDNNTFDEIANDGMHLDWSSFTGAIGGRSTSGNVVSYNTFTRVRRIPIEIQTQPGGGCPGGCVSTYRPTANLVVKGNYAHDYAFPFYDTWGASLVPDGAITPYYLNNTFIANPGSTNGYAACMESSGRNSLSQGNVCVSVPGAPKFYGGAIAQGGGSNSTFTSTYQNNVFCGHPRTTLFVQEPSSSNPYASRMIDQHNYKNGNSCPAGANPTASNIDIAYTSAGNQSFPSGGNGTWSLYVVSNLSIKYVQFFLDGSATAISSKEIQDLNTNFETDRKWLYHATIDTTNLTNGPHTILAVATDVSGATQSAANTFSR